MKKDAQLEKICIGALPVAAVVREMTIDGPSVRAVVHQIGTPKQKSPSTNFSSISIWHGNSQVIYWVRRFIALLLIIGASIAIPANGSDPQAGDLNSGLRLEWDEATSNYKLAWWGVGNRTYFLIVSDDLVHWRYVPLIQSGINGVLEHRFPPDGERLFSRLKHMDDLPGDPFDGDIDGDGLSNWSELLLGTDPFGADAPTSVDGISKLAKLLAGINPLDDPASDPTLATTRLVILTPVELPQ